MGRVLHCNGQTTAPNCEMRTGVLIGFIVSGILAEQQRPRMDNLLGERSRCWWNCAMCVDTGFLDFVESRLSKCLLRWDKALGIQSKRRNYQDRQLITEAVVRSTSSFLKADNWKA